MFGYHIRLAWLSFRKTPVISSLIVCAIGLGVGTCISILTVYALMTEDPVPAVSDRLFTYKLNNQDELTPGRSPETAEERVGYVDAMNISRSSIPVNHSLHYQSAEVYYPDNGVAPFRDQLRLANAGFFTLHRIPFLYGAGWSAEEEAARQHQVVLTRDLNERLFAGANSVGESLRIGSRSYEVVGVLDHYEPVPNYLELDGGNFATLEGAFIPFSLTRELGLRKRGGSTMCTEDPDSDTWESFLEADCYWIHHWVELPDDESVQAFRQYLDDYALEQRQFGRFLGPFEHEVHDVMSWLQDQDVVNPDYQILLGIAFLFLVVCLLNCVGLLLAKFIGKAPEMSLRRAVGGSRAMIFRQHLVEIGLIGALGGLVGILVSLLGLVGIRTLYTSYEKLTHLNLELMAVAILLAIASTLLAGMLPAWRVCRLPVSQYLKSQ